MSCLPQYWHIIEFVCGNINCKLVTTADGNIMERRQIECKTRSATAESSIPFPSLVELQSILILSLLAICHNLFILAMLQFRK